MTNAHERCPCGVPNDIGSWLIAAGTRWHTGCYEAALRFAHKSTAELIGEIPEGDIDQALIPSIEEVPGAGGAGDEDNGSKPN